MPSLLDSLKAEKEQSTGRSRKKIDVWLEQYPDAEDEFREALAWFLANRTHDFGWRQLEQQFSKRWSHFPSGGHNHVMRWAHGQSK